MAHMSYRPIQFSGSLPNTQHVLNGLGARDRPERPKVQVSARVIWEIDGEEWVVGDALRLDPGVAIFVQFADPRCKFTGVWLGPNDVWWEGK